ncbi:helix-turn-helix domain-containing protein [Streptomyces oryzae]|uniref:Helix-turn-helix domain-containing protein n=2 Tax=Streptomyces oryzae TaxID=1434886 RepID=A0ABS3XJT7_9ACTN|nr:helix-turn-helix domain-containing protein [Streptomyces oryzae]
MPTDFRLVGTDTFRGSLTTASLGPVQLSTMAYSSFSSIRTPRLIRVSDPECIQLALVRSGPHIIEQNRRNAPARPGELLLFDSSRPFDSYADGEALLLQIPRSVLPLRGHRFDPVLARPLPGDRGTGRLLAEFLTRVARDGYERLRQDATRLGTVALDLAAAVLADHLDRAADLPADSRQHVLYLRITAFVQCHLGDPALTPGEVAAAHHISLRSLHRLFQQHGTSIGAWIRSRRLERCRRDLADPRKSRIPIHAIAARWGYPRPGDFTRAFRTAYGITPSDYREQEQRAGALGPWGGRQDRGSVCELAAGMTDSAGAFELGDVIEDRI